MKTLKTLFAALACAFALVLIALPWGVAFPTSAHADETQTPEITDESGETVTGYTIKLYDGDGNIFATRSDIEADAQLKPIIDEILDGPDGVALKRENLLGWALTAGGDVADITALTATSDIELYAVYDGGVTDQTDGILNDYEQMLNGFYSKIGLGGISTTAQCAITIVAILILFRLIFRK